MTSKFSFTSILAAIVALFGALLSPGVLDYLPGKVSAGIVIVGILLQAITPSIKSMQDAWANASTAHKSFGLGAIVAILVSLVGAASSPDVLALLPAKVAAGLTVLGIFLNALSPAIAVPNTTKVAAARTLAAQ